MWKEAIAEGAVVVIGVYYTPHCFFPHKDSLSEAAGHDSQGKTDILGGNPARASPTRSLACMRLKRRHGHVDRLSTRLQRSVCTVTAPVRYPFRREELHEEIATRS